MKLIIPMAGRGTRLRPHTLTTPKPLIKIAGKPIVQWLVEDLARTTETPFEEIAFVIGRFGEEIERDLLEIASKVGAKGHIMYQDEALGTAHAIYCAAELLSGPVIVAFADTLFKADFKIDRTKESIIWVKKVDDPSAFGVVKLNPSGHVSEFIEKPATFVSDLAIIGIYYFKDGEILKQEISYLLENGIKVGKEYQLTTALENMKNKGITFQTGAVQEWLDCGNKQSMVQTHSRYLEFLSAERLISETALINESVIIPPVFIGEGAIVRGSVIGPFVSVGSHSEIQDCIIKNSIVQEKTLIHRMLLSDSMVGHHVSLKGTTRSFSVGDYNVMDEM